MRYWVRFLIFDENQSGTGNHQGREPLGTGLVAFCVMKNPKPPSLMVPPDGSPSVFKKVANV